MGDISRCCDASCRDYTDEDWLPNLTEREKETGNLLRREIIEKRKSYPEFVDYRNCGRKYSSEQK